MNNKTLYCIFYDSYEFDDPYYTTSEKPLFFTTNKELLEKTWNELKQKEIDHFNKFKQESVDQEYKDDYTIEKNTDDELELYMGNWDYRWWRYEYELDKLL